MNFFRTALLSLGLLLATGAYTAQAQNNMKIGYTNAELILSFMPEAKQIEQQLRTFEQKLMQNLTVKQSYMDTKRQELQDMRAAGTLSAEEEQSRLEEIEKLQMEIEQSYQDAQTKLLTKREELLAPLVERIQKAIDAVAERQGYTYIMNANVNGTSILLYGPEENNITIDVLKEMGIEVPEQMPEDPGMDPAGTGTGGPVLPPGGGTGGGSGGQ